MSSYNVAVVGAAGMVGREMAKTLEQRRFPVAEFRPLDIAAVAGTPISFNGRDYPCVEATEENFAGIDIAFFSAGADASLDLAPKAVRQGATVIDNSSAWRMNPDCPLVVPEVNANDLAWHKGIIANPNCSTIQMVVALKPLHDRARIKRVVVSTYQAASGAGKNGVDELQRQAREVALGQPVGQARTFQYQLAFNLIPQIDVFVEGGYTKEELKMVNESRKIMSLPDLRASATCVRVPVFRAHSIAIQAEFERPVSVEEAREAIAGFKGSEVVDDPATNSYPMPLDYSGREACGVGRIRKDLAFDNGLSFWVVGDQLWKGAALNAIQIAEALIDRDLLAVARA